MGVQGVRSSSRGRTASYFELLLYRLPELKHLSLDGLGELAVVSVQVPQEPGQRAWKAEQSRRLVNEAFRAQRGWGLMADLVLAGLGPAGGGSGS